MIEVIQDDKKLKGAIENMVTYIGFAGTYTRQSSEGIYQFALDAAKGELIRKGVAAKVQNPTYLTITKNQDYLYTVAQEEDQGGVYAYKINPDTNSLEQTGSQLEAGAPPCYVEVVGNTLTTANYHKGSVGQFFVKDSGEISPGSFVEHEGKGPHERQEKSHLHFAGFSPCKQYVFACDLGGDEVITYQTTAKGLEYVTTLKVKSGSGPRHLTFHPNGNYAFLISELSSEVAVLAYDATNGNFKVEQYIKTIPETFTETNDASAIKVSLDGHFLYAGNRGHNSIAVFEINQETMELTLIERVASGGEWPRDFAIDPSESYLVVSNQHTGNVVLFTRDQSTGKLSQTSSSIEVPEVVCLKFM